MIRSTQSGFAPARWPRPRDGPDVFDGLDVPRDALKSFDGRELRPRDAPDDRSLDPDREAPELPPELPPPELPPPEPPLLARAALNPTMAGAI